MDSHPVDIRDFLAAYSNKDIIYCPNPGNGGDGFIAHAAFTLFDALSIRYGFMHFDEQVQGKTIFYGGGGNLIEGRYPHAHQFLTNNLGNGNSIVILPSTVKGFHEMLAQAPDLTILCRESVSYSSLRESGFPSERLFLCDDLAFTIDPATLAVPQKGPGTDFFSGETLKAPATNRYRMGTWTFPCAGTGISGTIPFSRKPFADLSFCTSTASRPSGQTGCMWRSCRPFMERKYFSTRTIISRKRLSMSRHSTDIRM